MARQTKEKKKHEHPHALCEFCDKPGLQESVAEDRKIVRCLYCGMTREYRFYSTLNRWDLERDWYKP